MNKGCPGGTPNSLASLYKLESLCLNTIASSEIYLNLPYNNLSRTTRLGIRLLSFYAFSYIAKTCTKHLAR
ncbi:hypothetical protein CFP56_029294 [Quercus suber]|uniref:Uncharacterized protein n=1 Tax=Quercus suber TaxID=58331 RepID=A0AAW0MEV9_QUESU